MTQLELALDAGVSARHLSFVETGRSKPGREMLLRVAEQLDVPFRERNQLLLAAGHAPAFPERALEDPELAGVRDQAAATLREEQARAPAERQNWQKQTEAAQRQEHESPHEGRDSRLGLPRRRLASQVS